MSRTIPAKSILSRDYFFHRGRANASRGSSLDLLRKIIEFNSRICISSRRTLLDEREPAPDSFDLEPLNRNNPRDLRTYTHTYAYVEFTGEAPFTLTFRRFASRTSLCVPARRFFLACLSYYGTLAIRFGCAFLGWPLEPLNLVRFKQEKRFTRDFYRVP